MTVPTNLVGTMIVLVKGWVVYRLPVQFLLPVRPPSKPIREKVAVQLIQRTGTGTKLAIY
eukprot:SAG31_NODE_3862_length_3810_cov_32.413096_1_plen_60_part_00